MGLVDCCLVGNHLPVWLWVRVPAMLVYVGLGDVEVRDCQVEHAGMRESTTDLLIGDRSGTC